MNSIVIFPHEVVGDSVVLTGERAKSVCAKMPGNSFRVGILGEYSARAEVIDRGVKDQTLSLKLSDITTSPSKYPITLIVGVSRPLTVRKVMSAAVMLGVERVCFVGTENGEKSYQQATIFQPEQLQLEVIKALEQTGDAIPPAITRFASVRAFLEDSPRLSDQLRFIFDEEFHDQFVAPPMGNASVQLAIGPEAGWSENEKNQFSNAGFQPKILMTRSLRVEVAATIVVGAFALGFESIQRG